MDILDAVYWILDDELALVYPAFASSIEYHSLQTTKNHLFCKKNKDLIDNTISPVLHGSKLTYRLRVAG